MQRLRSINGSEAVEEGWWRGEGRFLKGPKGTKQARESSGERVVKDKASVII